MTLYERVEQLREQVGRFANARLLTGELSRNAELKHEVQSLYSLIFGKHLTGCLNCIVDAVFEILNKKTITEIKPVEYLLPAGALLHDVVNMDGSKAMSNANISEELALYHLATNPGCEGRFIRLPEDWNVRVDAYKQRMRQEEGISKGELAADMSEPAKEGALISKAKNHQ